MEIITHVLTNPQPSLREDSEEAARRRKTARENIEAIGGIKVGDDTLHGDIIELSNYVVPKPAVQSGGQVLTTNDDGTYEWKPIPVDQTLDPASENAVSGKAVAAAIDRLDDKVELLFDSIQPLSPEDASRIVVLEPGDAEDPLDFDIPD